MRGVIFNTIEEYFASFPKEVQNKLSQIRKVLREAVPEAEEVISYNMPAIKFKKVLVYYAANKKHIGYYPTASGVEAFKEELTPYNPSKGTIRFSLEEPLPFDLIKVIAEFRFEEVSNARFKKK